MQKVNVLITGIGGPTAQGVAQGLKDIDEVRIVGSDRREITPGNQFCDTTYKIPRYTQKELYKEAIMDIVRNENIHAVFPSLHEEIELFCELKDTINAAVALPQSHLFSILMDKESTYHYLREIGLHRYIPEYYGFNHASELRQIIEHAFSKNVQVVVKQVNGHGAMGFAILTDHHNYLEAVKKGKAKVYRIDDYCEVLSGERHIAMELLDDPEYSVDMFLHNGNVVTAIPRERTGVSNGIVLDGRVVFNQELIDAAGDIATSLISDGFINLQFMTGQNGYKLTDINPRFCGSQVMSLGAGVNFPHLFLQYNVLGEFPEVHPRWNTRMLRYREQLFIYEEEASHEFN
ncbi:ATP-grasp domain-containing protein [Lentibacillus jeotgali]|uniref:ATP-grasp domain-containing protein n=1 Tax=Lentibacillus jeotgali TaxID=558169 RepID=UPI0002628834|nr:ATP-grasp domain-containing protein [Lentibacillus jeotgali]